MPAPDEQSKCPCQNCGGNIEYPAAAEGMEVPCPHCGWQTLLRSTANAGGATQPKRLASKILLAVGVLALLGAAAAVYWFRFRPGAIPPSAPAPATVVGSATNTNAPPKPRPAKPPPDPWHGLMASPVKVGKSGVGNLVYAVGSLSNSGVKERFGVKVELDILDNNGGKIGTATDYTSSVEPGKVWTFHAMITQHDAARAKLTAVTEE